MNISTRTKIWQELAQSEMCIWLMTELRKYNCLGLKHNLTEHFKNKDDAMEEIVRVAMTIKLRDEKKYKLELTRKRDNMR